MRVSRRTFVGTALAGAGVATFGSGLPGSVLASDGSGWPPQSAWDALRGAVGGRLIDVAPILAPCSGDTSAPACLARLDDLKNPFFIQDQPGGFQTNGWLDAWTATASPYAVAAESPADIVAAVNFARTHGVRLVVKGGGHDYLGRSSAADSLLVWTHRMRDIVVHDAFRATGAPASEAGVPALTAGAGTRWLEAYQAAAPHGFYVQGGGCTSVGVAGGFIQGGGFGSLSKRFGTGAGNVLEYEVVTADGDVLIANAHQNEDLFWALRGGGGGTFGIVTKVTIRAHPLPDTLGLLSGTIQASGDDAFRALLDRLVAFYPDVLDNPTWGEQIAIRPDNSIEFFMTFVDLDGGSAIKAFDRLTEQPLAGGGTLTADLKTRLFPMTGLWDQAYWDRTDPDFIIRDDRPNAPPNHFWWATNDGEVSEFVESYQSRWIPAARFRPDQRADLADTLFRASRHASVRMQINKGLSGAPAEVVARERKTSLNPAAIDAATIVIIASRKKHAYPGLPGHGPDLDEARAGAAKVNAAMDVLRRDIPESGVYGNECDFFEPDWRNAIYGPHYQRLSEIKRRYDPDNLFRVHHGVEPAA